MAKLMGFRTVVGILMESPLYFTMSLAERLDLARGILAGYLT